MPRSKSILPAIFLLLALSLLACQQNQSDSTISSSTTENNLDDEYEQELAEMEVAYEGRKRDFRRRMSEKAFRFREVNDCNPDELSEELLSEHGRSNPFGVEKTVSEGKIVLKFRFNETCCEEFAGDLDWENDTLNLRFFPIGYRPCDCLCLYEYQFEIQTQGKIPAKILINGQEIPN